MLTAPLRQALRWRSDTHCAAVPRAVLLWTLFYGVLSALSFFLFVGAQQDLLLPILGSFGNTSGVRGFLDQGPLIMAQSFGMLCMCLISCIAGRSGWVAWLLLAVIYVPQVVIPYRRGSFRGDLFMFGMVIYKFPCQGIAKVARIMRAYWLLLL